VIDTGHVSDVSLTRPRRSTQPTLLSLCTGSNPVDTVTLRIAFTRWLAGCYGRCSVSLTVSNVCVGNHSPTLATWAYTVNIFTYIHTYTHTYIDYAMNHKNKQIYSNREGANGSHRINDHDKNSVLNRCCKAGGDDDVILFFCQWRIRDRRPQYHKVCKWCNNSFNAILVGTHTTQQCYFEWKWVLLSDIPKYSMTRSARGLSATAELLVLVVIRYQVELLSVITKCIRIELSLHQFWTTAIARSLCDSRATCTCCYHISGCTVISYYQMYPYWIVITSVLNNCEIPSYQPKMLLAAVCNVE